MQINRDTRGMAAALVVGTFAALLTAQSHAADLGRGGYRYDDYQPQPSAQRQFYVRGDVGIGRNAVGGVSQADLTEHGGSFLSRSLADTVYLGAGIGWQLSSRFRLDLTGEYRATAALKAMDNLSAELAGPDGHLQANTLYQGNLSSYVGLLNGYWDLFNVNGFTPYIGAGIGYARHKISGVTTASAATFTDATTGEQFATLTQGTSLPRSQNSLAWALMAGTSYDLSPNAKLDLGYRYLNLGSGIAATSSLLDCVCGSVGAPLKLSDLEAHEFRIGIRWTLGAAGGSRGAPLK